MQVPVIVDCAEKFADLLDKHATSGKVFRLEEEATRTTLDIIGRTICDHDFGTLTQPDNDFVRYMRSSLLWTETTNSLNPFQRFSKFKTAMSQ
jgi:acid phosphatase